jgi:surface antigen
MRLMCLAFSGLMLALAGGAAAQTTAANAPSEDVYVPDLSQSYVQELGQPPRDDARALSRDDTRAMSQDDSYPDPQPLIAEEAPASADQNCRDYEQTVLTNGTPRVARGTACQDGEGSWHLASSLTLTSVRGDAMQRTAGTCREFQQPNVAIGESRGAYGTACQQQDGVWRFVASQGNAPASRFCRSYAQEIVDGGDSRTAYGTACAQPDGSWRIVSAPTLGAGGDYAMNEPAQEVPSYRDVPAYPDQSYDAPPPVREAPAWETFAYAPSYAAPLYSPAAPGPSYNPSGSYGRSYDAPARWSAPSYTERSTSLIERSASAIVRPFRAPRSYEAPRYRGHSGWRERGNWRAERNAYRRYRG